MTPLPIVFILGHAGFEPTTFGVRVQCLNPEVFNQGSASLHSNPSVYFIIICILFKYNQIPIRSFGFASIRFAFISETVSPAAASSAIDFIMLLLFTDIAASLIALHKFF